MNTKSNDVSYKNDDLLSIKEVIEYTGKSPVYVRRAIQNGWLKYHSKEPLGNKGNQFRYMIKFSDVLAWRKKAGSRSRRTDGRRKYNFYLTPEEKKKFEAWKKQEIPAAEFGLANPPKES